MTYFYTVLESTTDEVTDVTETGSREIGTTESVTTGIYTTEGIFHLRENRCFIVCTIKYIFLYR